MVGMVYLNGPPNMTGNQLQQTLEASPNTGNNIARFAVEMERAMAETKTAYIKRKDDERDKEKQSRIRAVVQSPKDTSVDQRTQRETETHAKKKFRPVEEDFKEELYDSPLLGLSVDYKA
ncbi:MAG: hypothetical protein K6G40_06555 [Eubacterium sp.]|nr:hypothetical protein [Eubacterium sp.]